MKKFDELKDIWSTNEPNTNSTQAKLFTKKDELTLLKNQYLFSGIGLFCLTVFIVWFTYFNKQKFLFEISYIALSSLAVCTTIMVMINLYNVFLISKLDETLAPRFYLSKWHEFYQLRFRFFSLYAPFLFLAMLFSFAVYLPEILGYYPTVYYKVAFVIGIVMFYFIYFIVGKKSILKEKMKLNEINNSMQMLEN